MSASCSLEHFAAATKSPDGNVADRLLLRFDIVGDVGVLSWAARRRGRGGRIRGSRGLDTRSKTRSRSQALAL